MATTSTRAKYPEAAAKVDMYWNAQITLEARLYKMKDGLYVSIPNDLLRNDGVLDGEYYEKFAVAADVWTASAKSIKGSLNTYYNEISSRLRQVIALKEMWQARMSEMEVDTSRGKQI